MRFLALSILFVFFAQAYAQNYPCSGKKGGVARCVEALNNHAHTNSVFQLPNEGERLCITQFSNIPH